MDTCGTLILTYLFLLDSVPVDGVGAVYKIREYNQNMWRSSPTSCNNQLPRPSFKMYHSMWDARGSAQAQSRNIHYLNTSLKSNRLRKSTASSSTSSLPTIKNKT